MDTDSFISYIKKHIYVDIARGVKKICDTSKYELERPLTRGENRKSY